MALAALALAVAGTATAATTAPVAKHPVKGVQRSIDADGSVEHLRPGTLSSFAPSLLDNAKFSFTAPGQVSTSARMATAERAFRFTPSGQTENRHPLSIGVTSRVVAVAPDTSRAAAPLDVAANPAAYNIDLSVGWRGFAVSGGYSRADNVFTGVVPTSGLLPRRDAVDVGLSYGGKSWKTSLQIGAETIAPLNTALTSTPTERRYSVELGGAYALSPGVALTGGVRYKLSPTAPGLPDTPRPDQSIYLGTAVSF